MRIHLLDVTSTVTYSFIVFQNNGYLIYFSQFLYNWPNEMNKSLYINAMDEYISDIIILLYVGWPKENETIMISQIQKETLCAFFQHCNFDLLARMSFTSKILNGKRCQVIPHFKDHWILFSTFPVFWTLFCSFLENTF